MSTQWPAVFLDALTRGGAVVWRASWQASALAGVVLVVQLALGQRISARWRHAMWMLVLVRLVLPVVPSSPLSMFNLAPAAAEARPSVPAPAEVKRPAPRPPFPMPVRTVPVSAPLQMVERTPADDVVLSEAPVSIAAGLPAPSSIPGAIDVPHAPRETFSSTLKADWRTILAAFWAGGALLLLARTAVATLRVAGVLRRLERVTDPACVELLRSAAAELHVRRPPTLLTGDGPFSPALVGCVRPQLLVPRDLLEQFGPAELRLIFLHELAHQKRRDVAINWFATLVCAVHWMNPVAWLVVRRLRLERELACDEMVMSAAAAAGGDADRRAYGRTILKLLETYAPAAGPRPLPAVAVVGGVGILEGKQQMKRRITMIARFATRRTRLWSAFAVAIMLALGACALTDRVNAKPGDPTTRPSAKADDTNARESAAAPKYDWSASQPAVGRRGSAAAGPQRGEYVLVPKDLVNVTVYDLEGPGLRTIKAARVSDAGNIAMPYLDEPVHIAGLTEEQAQRTIAERYKGKAANVSVVVAEPHPQTIVSALIDGGEVPRRAAANDRKIRAGDAIVIDVRKAGEPGAKGSRFLIVVPDSGQVQLPDQPDAKASVAAVGLTETELKEKLLDAYRKAGVEHAADDVILKVSATPQEAIDPRAFEEPVAQDFKRQLDAIDQKIASSGQVGLPADAPATAALRAQRKAIEAKLSDYTRALTEAYRAADAREGAKAGGSPEAWSERIAQLKAQRDQMRKQYSPNHPAMQKIEDQIETEIAAARMHAERPTTIARDERVTVSIVGLLSNDSESIKTARVDADGNINLPYVGAVKAEGLKAVELEKAVAKRYQEAHLMQDPLIVVSLPDRGESHQLKNNGNYIPGPAGGAAPGAAAAGAKEEGASHEDQAARVMLERKLPEVKFDGIPLPDVIDYLRDVTSANFTVDWRGMEAIGIDKNVPVTMNLKDVAFGEIMKILLREIDPRLTFDVEHNVVQVGLRADVAAQRPAPSGNLTVKTYDVADLVSSPDNKLVKQRTDELAKVVADGVRHGSGGEASVDAFGTKLVVHASENGHRDIDELLKLLREPSASDDRMKEAAKLWRSNFMPRIINVAGKDNAEQVRAEFAKEMKERFGESFPVSKVPTPRDKADDNKSGK